MYRLVNAESDRSRICVRGVHAAVPTVAVPTVAVPTVAVPTVAVPTIAIPTTWRLFTARALLSRYMPWPCVCLSVCLSVRHKSEFY